MSLYSTNRKLRKSIVDKLGQNRELYLTQIEDIRIIIKLLLEKEPKLKKLKWHDPFAADGRWADVAKEFGIDCYSSDIFPLNDSVFKLNAFDIIPNKETLYIGNPPFSLAKKIVNHFKYKCAFIMGSSCFSLGLKHLWSFKPKLKFKTNEDLRIVPCFFVYFDENRNDIVKPCLTHLVPEPRLLAAFSHSVPMKNNYYIVRKGVEC